MVWTAAVLCGGQSRRMGRDKATLEHDGEVLASRVANALLRAGAAEVICVGGDTSALVANGLRAVADTWPAEGPLGGLLTALQSLGGTSEIVLVASCDLVHPDPDAMGEMVAALVGTSADVAVPLDRGRRRQWLHATWRASVRGALAQQFEVGERALHRAVAAAGLRVVEVETIAAAALADADAPGDLPGR